MTASVPLGLVAGIYGSIARGAQVLTMSLGFRPTILELSCPVPDPERPLCRAAPDCLGNPLDPLCQAMALATARDVIVVAAAGNDGTDEPDWPAIEGTVLGAGGIDPLGQIWDDCPSASVCDPCFECLRHNCPLACAPCFECGSNRDSSMFYMPAEQVVSTVYRGFEWIPGRCSDDLLPGFPGYGPCTGTSMSAPFLAGSVGILRSADPLRTPDDLEKVLLQNLDNPMNWESEHGRGKPNVAAALEDVLGEVAGQPLLNRLTPLFSLYSHVGEDHFYTIVPQMGSAAIWSSHGYFNVGPDVPGYDKFPGTSCHVSPCDPDPGASVYIFTGHRSPNGHDVVPLYRMSLEGTFPGGPNNPNNRDVTYTTEEAGVQAFHDLLGGNGYQLDGIEGYIYQRCSPEPSCIPPGAVRLYRLYNSALDDTAIFPESELAQWQAAGYASRPGFNDWIGYVYENVDSDFDGVIDGFETLAGTDPSVIDSDCDGISDSAELQGYPSSDPQAPPMETDWIISQNCTITTNRTAPLNVVVQNQATLTIIPGGAVDIDFAQHHLAVKGGSKVIVRRGATIH